MSAPPLLGVERHASLSLLGGLGVAAGAGFLAPWWLLDSRPWLLEGLPSAGYLAAAPARACLVLGWLLPSAGWIGLALLRRCHGGCRAERDALVFSIPLGGEVRLLPDEVEAVEDRPRALRVRARGRGPLAELLAPLVAPGEGAHALLAALPAEPRTAPAAGPPPWWRTREGLLGLALLPVLLVQGGLLPYMARCYAEVGVCLPPLSELTFRGLLAAWAVGALLLVAALARTPRAQAWATAGVLGALGALLAQALLLPLVTLISPL